MNESNRGPDVGAVVVAEDGRSFLVISHAKNGTVSALPVSLVDRSLLEIHTGSQEPRSVWLSSLKPESLEDTSLRVLLTIERATLAEELRKQTKQLAGLHCSVEHLAVPDFTPGKRIPYAGRVFGEREVQAAVDASLDFWLTAGRFTDQFERAMARYIGVRNCHLVNSGSSANLLAFGALTTSYMGSDRINAGDEVITVAAGFPTTISPIFFFGCIPVFVDVAPPTWNIDVTRLEEARTSRTRAVMIAHTLGNPFDIEAVTAFCKKHDLFLIEDNCDALGAEYSLNGKSAKTGTFGDVATSSFYPPHHITMGEGGAVYCHSPKIARAIACLRDWGRDCWCASGKDNTCGTRFEWALGTLPPGYDHKYIYSHLGFNLKASDLQAAIGVEQLARADLFVAARRKNWSILREALGTLEDVLILPEPTPNSVPSWFGFLTCLRDDAPFTRGAVVRYLEGRGVQTRMLFAGNIVRQPCITDLAGKGERYRVVGDLANSDVIMNHGFWLGVYPGLSESMIGYMIDSLKTFTTKKELWSA